jgi:uncharacterized protein (TIGR02597 family)
MRSFTSLATALLLSLCAVETLPAQVSTVPVGFNTATLPAASSASAPSNTVVSAPFYQVAKFQGANTAVGSNQLTFSGTTFTGTLTTPPYLARIKSGPSAGRFFVITSNTDTQLTLDTRGYTLVTGSPANANQLQVNVGDSVEICPANTLGTLFPSGSPFFPGTSASQADNIYLWNGTTWDIYFYDSSPSVNHWRKSPGIASANLNTKVILPDQAMFITRRPTSSLNLTFLGTVPSTQEQTDIPGAGSTFVANRFPVDMILAATDANGVVDPNVKNALNLQASPTWQPGTSASQADNIFLWNGTTWDIYFYDNSPGVKHWRKSPGIASNNANNVVLPLGGGIFVVRKSTAQGSASTYAKQLPYTL